MNAAMHDKYVFKYMYKDVLYTILHSFKALAASVVSLDSWNTYLSRMISYYLSVVGNGNIYNIIHWCWLLYNVMAVVQRQ